ncbi:MAG: sugar phosphate nucleotidyltransferase [Nitriliruptoraceae bacterium]
MSVREAMIVAGGAGTRLRPLTDTVPKPLVPFCTEPFLAGVLHRLAAAGVDRVWLVVGADPAPFAVLEPVAARLGMTLEAVPEPEPLDTAGGVRAVIDRCEGSVLVLNGDVLTDVDLAEVARRHAAAGADASLVLTRVPDTSSFGVCVLEGDRITGFVEKPPPGTLPGHDTVNAGTYVLEPAALAAFPAGRPLSFEREVFPGLVADGARVQGIVSDAAWADLGTPERYLDGHRAALDGELDWPALDRHPADAAGIRRGRDVEVADSARLMGPVLLAEGVRVGPGARVGPHVVAGPGTVLGADVEVAASVLGEGTRLGPRGKLRHLATGSAAHLGADVVVTGPVLVADGARLPDGSVRGPSQHVPRG